MSYYMTNIVITPTLYEEKRLEAISYFSRCSKEAALKIHKKNKYKDIKLRLNVIAVAIIEAKKRYFDERDILTTVLLLRLYYSVK